MFFFYFLFILLIIASFGAQWKLRSKFNKYQKTSLIKGYSGEEVAKMMLRANGIFDVGVTQVDGQLTDHYNPMNKTVNLSPDVFYGRNAASVAVAAHEVGHAVQHATGYSWLQMRSLFVPFLSFVSPWLPWIIMLGGFLLNTFPILLGVGIVLYAGVTLFSFITLPVEFDASARGLAFVRSNVAVTDEENDIAKDALWWAGTTYVIAALAALAELIYLILRFMGRSKD